MFEYHGWATLRDSQDAYDVVEAFRRIARVAPWSYGMLHLYDDEVRGEHQNRWVVWVMKRGSALPEADPYLSPHVPVVEDLLDD